MTLQWTSDIVSSKSCILGSPIKQWLIWHNWGMYWCFLPCAVACWHHCRSTSTIFAIWCLLTCSGPRSCYLQLVLPVRPACPTFAARPFWWIWGRLAGWCWGFLIIACLNHRAIFPNSQLKICIHGAVGRLWDGGRKQVNNGVSFEQKGFASQQSLRTYVPYVRKITSCDCIQSLIRLDYESSKQGRS